MFVWQWGFCFQKTLSAWMTRMKRYDASVIRPGVTADKMFLVVRDLTTKMWLIIDESSILTRKIKKIEPKMKISYQTAERDRGQAVIVSIGEFGSYDRMMLNDSFLLASRFRSAVPCSGCSFGMWITVGRIWVESAQIVGGDGPDGRWKCRWRCHDWVRHGRRRHKSRYCWWKSWSDKHVRTGTHWCVQFGGNDRKQWWQYEQRRRCWHGQSLCNGEWRFRQWDRRW